MSNEEVPIKVIAGLEPTKGVWQYVSVDYSERTRRWIHQAENARPKPQGIAGERVTFGQESPSEQTIMG